MNIYSYIKAQNYQGFDIEIVRKILIQLMQALLFLHYVRIHPLGRKISYIAISNLKTLSSKSWGSLASN
jgi:hypothetical protein